MPTIRTLTTLLLLTTAGAFSCRTPQSQSPRDAQTDQGPSPSDDAASSDASTPVVLNPPHTFVTLFKWRYKDIATECARFLGPNGYGGVQISPPNPHITRSAWWNMYQPTNFTNLVSDQGNEADLRDMISACHKAGVRVYADAVVNHMTGTSGVGTDGAPFAGATSYLGGITPTFFHPDCAIQGSDYDTNRNNVVTCRLVSLPDLATETAPVRALIAGYLGKLRDLGIDGYRIDAAKHMWATDIQAFLAGVPTTTLAGEPLFIAQEIIPDGTVNRSDYFVNGTINEFSYTYALRDAFRSAGGASVGQLPAMVGTGDGGGTRQVVPSASATVFVNNWDTERDEGQSLNLTSDAGGHYDLANIYMLASPYGRANVESGFSFLRTGASGGSDANAPAASPYDATGNAVITTTCASAAACGWDFVHRWTTVYPMVAFRNAAASQPMTDVQTGNANQLAFGRGAVGFVAINNDGAASWNTTFTTGLPAGTYCNIIHGLLSADGKTCAADSVTVNDSGAFTATMGPLGGTNLPAIAIYTGQKVR
ncbi:MAG TPA: alpha-amylase family protein [Polyangia bacterium]|nr:alpha-amylase family protein [Polyangia bacterium]